MTQQADRPENDAAAPDELSWLNGGGEMGERIRAKDWSQTPLGPIGQWPQSLRTSVSLCITSTFPILVAWGPDDIQIYNDAYRPICGAKHPEALGQSFKICWATALPVVGDAFDRAHGGEGVYIRDQQMFLDRYGYLEEAFMTFSFSSIRVESGQVGGVFHPITESTAQVLNARRTQGLRDLTAAVARSRTIAELCALTAGQYASLSPDLPFVQIYELCADGSQVQLRGGAGLAEGSALAPSVVAIGDDAGWPFSQALAGAQSAAQSDGLLRVDDLAARFGAFSCAPYDESPSSALLLPVRVAGQERPFGFIVAGVSACRALDADYLNFYALLANAFTTAVGNVLAYEQEQRRVAALAEIDRAKTAFFSNVSHEFRTPLTLILGPLDDILADDPASLAPRQRERIELTNRNALRLLKLVNSLLDFSRIEAGRVQASYAPTDLALLTGDLASVFRAAMEKAGLAYDVALEALGEPVHVDRDMWEKIVFNLLSNAFKFTLTGGVSVSLKRVGAMARLTVRDSGTGISAEELPRVFERFHRIEGAQGRTHEGTGIGLALIQELVRLHGGAIFAESVAGQGSAFHVDIPVGSAHLPAERLVAAPEADDATRMGEAFVEEALRWLPGEEESATPPAGAPADDVRAARPRARILVADDNNDMRAYVQSLLERDAIVETCADGEAAYAAILANPPDLLVSDVMMPKLDGFGLIKKIRANDAVRDLPIMLLSARAGEESRIEGLQAGADDYLVKPFSANELLARVHGQIDLVWRRRQAHQELAGRELYFRSLIDSSPAMFWTTDAQGHLTYLSRRWYDYTGRLPQEDLGEGWLAALHPDDAAATRASFLSASSRGMPFSLDYRLRGSNGLYRWVIGAGAPRFDADGAPAGFVGTVIDVHERKLLQDRFERVTQAAGIGVWYADHPFDSMQPNPQLRAQFALPDGAPVSMAQFYARVHADDRAGLSAELARALADGAGHDAEFRVGDGAALHAAAPRWIRSIGWAGRGEHGAASQFDGVTLDITSHKQAEEVLRRMADELSEANRRQGEFLVTLAHELRNPLAPISNGLETLRLAPDSPHREKTRDMMARQVRHLVRLIDDLLDVARIARGKEVLKRAPVLLAEVVNSAVEISTPLIEAGRHQLTVALPAAPLLLDIDAHRIAQVIGNLLNNAAKYTPPGGGIALRAEVDGDMLRMQISDNGIGIPADALATVFELFAQVPANRAHAQGGLGIGLHLVRRLVELHGGSVAVHSDGAGLGSTFALRLPLPGGGVEAEAPAALPAAGGPPLRILLVDDNIDAVDSMSALLESRGHDVAAAYDGATALLMAPAFQPDVIFLDIGLPGVSGLEVARRIRAVPELDGVGLVAVTGWASDSDRQRSREAGFDFHLSKPASLQAIDAVLAALGGVVPEK